MVVIDEVPNFSGLLKRVNGCPWYFNCIKGSECPTSIALSLDDIRHGNL